MGILVFVYQDIIININMLRASTTVKNHLNKLPQEETKNEIIIKLCNLKLWVASHE